MTLRDIQAEVKSRGLDWAEVQAVYRDLKEAEWVKREQPNAVREAAWMMYTASTPGSWPFCRNGFRRFARRIANGADHTIVPGYDEIAQQIGSEFPEYATDDGTQRLWDFLLSPHDRYPTREELYREAMDRVELGDRGQGTGNREEETVEVPF